MKSIYLDWNVYVYLICCEYPDIAESLGIAKSKGIAVPFSSIHIEEATNIHSYEEICTRLEFIGEISNQVYFENSVTDFGLVSRSPFEVYDTLNETPKINQLIKFLGNIITRPMFMASRAALGLDPQYLNNIDPKDIWGEIDRIILNSKHLKMLPFEFRDSPIYGFVRYAKNDSLERFGRINERIGGVKQRASGPDVMVAVLFSLLESFGYFPENKKVFQKASRFNDAAHCYYSLWSNICVSRDKGFRMKSKAVASLLGSDTVFLHPDNAVKKILDL
tara:strand:+ start:3953 stop:4783 length:831 start_codon:yes stop_codon:yes gene_type:complete